jgi:hypothetical protein
MMSSGTIGISPAAVRTSSQVPEFKLGQRARLDDPNLDTTVVGTKEYIYVTAAEAITAEGYVCLIDTGFSAEMLDTTSSAPGAGAGRPVGVALAAIASGGYGWLQIYGKCPIRTLASAALGTELTSSATPGAVDDATTSGLEVINGLSLGTATGGSEATNSDGFANYPHVGRTL